MADVNSTTTAESSPAAIDQGSQILKDMSFEEREHYFNTGDLPGSPKRAETGSAATQEETATSETAADAEPALPQEKDKDGRRPGQKLSAEERIRELIAANHKLREQLERRGERQESDEEIGDVPEKVAAAEEPVRPKYSDYDDQESYDAAMDVYFKQLVRSEAEGLVKQQNAAQTEAKANAEAKATMDAYNVQVVEAEAKYADFREVVGDPTMMIPAIAQVAIVQSEIGAELAYAIAKDKPLQKRLLALNEKSTVAVVKEIGKLEARLAAAAEEDSPAPRPTLIPPARTTTRAPRPTIEATGTAGRPRDPVQEAVTDGDFRAFDKARNAQDAEKVRRRN